MSNPSVSTRTFLARRLSAAKKVRRASESAKSKRTRSNAQVGFSFVRISSLYARISGRSTSIHCKDAGNSKRYGRASRSEEHTSELQSRLHLVCRLLLEKKKNITALRQASWQYLAAVT